MTNSPLTILAEKIEKLDKAIAQIELTKSNLEASKQIELRKVVDLFELQMIERFTLPSGFSIIPDNKHDIELDDIGSFLKWLKNNCDVEEVLAFFETAFKKKELLNFVNMKANEQRLDGIMEPKIDGVTIGDVNYRRLKTKHRKGK